ncbi:MAG: zinc ribbon domain-containing protein [Methanoregula sp.]|jgi:putative transposase
MLRRCGEFGRRFRKRFECPHCGCVLHADVNAAFNIANTPFDRASRESLFDQEEVQAFLLSKKQMRRLAKAKAQHKPVISPVPAVSVITDMAGRENLLAVLE